MLHGSRLYRAARPLARTAGFILALALPVAVSAVVQDSSPLIRSIAIDGLVTVDREQVLRVLPVREGEPMPRMAPGRLVRDIYATGYFQPDIRVNQKLVADGVVELDIEVRENPVVYDIAIAGADHIKPKRLTNLIPYRKGDVLKVDAVEEIRRAILTEYRRQGYYRATARVEVRPEATDPSLVAIRVVVIESERRKLRDVIIEGNEFFSDFTLRLMMENRGSWGPVTHFYDDMAIDSDLENIRLRYFNRGFLDAEVTLDELRTGGEGRGAWISPVVKIVEGPRYEIEDIEVKGATLFSDAEISESFHDLKGYHYSGERFRKAMDRVRELYGDAGYVNAEIDVDFIKNPDSATVRPRIEIEEKSQVRVGRVLVARPERDPNDEPPWYERWYSNVAPPIRDEAILENVSLESGDVFRSYEEARTKKELKSLGVFKKVDIRREATTDPDVTDVVIEVEEGATGRFTFGVGYGDATRGFVYVDYTERNLFGDGRDLSVYAMLGQRAAGGTVRYYDRHLAGSDTSLAVEAFHDRVSRRAYDETRSGGAVTFGRAAGENGRVRLRLKSYYVDLAADDKDDTLEDLDKGYVVASVRPGYTLDRRDDDFFPRKGDFFDAGVEMGYADGTLAKIEIEYERLTAVTRDLVWSARGRFGTMPVDADEVGISERYFLGGSESLRGFRFRGVGPKDPKDDDVPIGGASTLLVQNELRYPLIDSFAVLGFADLGFISAEPLDFDAPRLSAGVGARWDIKPYATVALDLGWALVSEEEDDTEILHFRLGSRF